MTSSTHPRRLGPALAALAALLVLAPAASASTASLVGGTLTVTAAPGEANGLEVYNSYGRESITDAAGVAPGAGCIAVSATEVECEGDATTGMEIDLGDGSDRLSVGFHHYLERPARVTGGPGDDRIDGVFDAGAEIDGGDGDDVVDGGGQNDTLRGGPGNDTVIGDGGNDTVDGGAGTDVLTGDSQALHSSDGNDTILARDGEQDRVDCGLGVDTVTADGSDLVDASVCEQVEAGAADAACAKAKQRVKRASQALKRARRSGRAKPIARARKQLKQAKRAARRAC